LLLLVVTPSSVDDVSSKVPPITSGRTVSISGMDVPVGGSGGVDRRLPVPDALVVDVDDDDDNDEENREETGLAFRPSREEKES
jgi:hypothetical protein